MVDTFSIDMHYPLLDTSEVWSVMKIVTDAVNEVHEDSGSWGRPSWALRVDGRKWESETLQELRAIAKEHSLSEFSVQWNEAFEGLQWSAVARVYSELPSALDLDAYAGRDRMVTEQAVRLVVATVKKRGIALVVEMTKTSSSNRVSGTAAGSARLRSKPSGRLRRVWVAVRPHLAQYVVGLALLVTAIYFAVAFGLRA